MNGDNGIVYYLLMVINNGIKEGNTDYSYVANNDSKKRHLTKKTIPMCKAFLNKKICSEIASYYEWAVEYSPIEMEIYGHALIYYKSVSYLKVFNSLPPDLIDFAAQTFYNFWTNLQKHCDPIDVGGNGFYDKIGKEIFPVMWNNF